MSIQWMLAAGFLYVEVFLVALLVLPVASPRQWSRIFKSRVLSVITNQVQIYFYIFFAILVLFLLDAVREMRKYSNVNIADTQTPLVSELQLNVKLFRAQRNFYISGFSLFLSLVIRRLVLFITSLAVAQAQNEASMRQAESASATARNLLNQTGESSQNTANEAHDRELNKLKDEIKRLKDELAKEVKDKTAIKNQAASVSKEYDRLTEEFAKLSKQSAGGDKKGD